MRSSFLLLILFIQVGFLSLGQNIVHKEILGRPTNNSIIVRAIFDDTVEVRVYYGVSSGNYTNQTSWLLFNPDTTNETVATISLNNLNQNTKYFYQLNFRHPGSSIINSRPEYTFHTARPAGDSFTFTIQADPHLDSGSDTALYRVCLLNQLDDQPDFMIDLGDYFMSEKLKNPSGVVPKDTIPYRCKLLRSFYEITGHSVPLFNLLGNHEGEAGWFLNGNADNIAVWSTNFRKKYYTNPIPDNFYTGDTTNYTYVGKREAYYAWTWGDALFVVLDPYWNTSPKPDSLHGWRWTLGKQQYNWLRATLETSNAKFKFVFAHQLIGGDKLGRGGIEYADKYEWGGANIDGSDGWAANRVGWYKPIKDLLEENRVTIFFHGHDHLYAKQDLNCLVYQELPQPSMPNFQNVPNTTAFGYVNGTIIPNAGHARVTVSPTGIHVEYIRAARPTQETGTLHNKDIADSYYIGDVNCYDSLQTNNNILNNENINLAAYPNPFVDETSIKYQITKSSDVILKIYDMLGNERSILVNQYQKTGSYVVNLNSKKLLNVPGVYLCKLIIGDSSENIKIISIK
jgi:hypothetical protein